MRHIVEGLLSLTCGFAVCYLFILVSVNRLLASARYREERERKSH